MSGAKHTLGPLNAIGGAVVKGEGGKRKYIAHCVTSHVTNEEAVANSVLYAAAPDLLAALETAMEYLEGDGGPELRILMHDLVELVRRAKGQ